MANSTRNCDLDLQLPPPKRCAPCPPDCPRCDGARLVRLRLNDGRLSNGPRVVCPECRGTGRREEAKDE